jgi:hypothetical protein
MGEEFPSEAWVKEFQEKVEKKLKALSLSASRIGVETGDLIVLQVFISCTRCPATGVIEVPVLTPVVDTVPESLVDLLSDFTARLATTWMVDRHHLIQDTARVLTPQAPAPRRPMVIPAKPAGE